MVNFNEEFGKTKLFTHSDLDGAGPIVLLKALDVDVDVQICNYDDVNQIISEFLDETKTFLIYDTILITDISVNKEVADRIQYIVDLYNVQVLLMDHHETAMWLNEYDWAVVASTDSVTNESVSGTLMVYNLLKEINEGIDMPYLERFAINVRDYDTWLWTKNNNELAKKLNDLFYIYDREDFVSKMVYRLGYELPLTDLDDQTILSLEKKRIERYYADLKKGNIHGIELHLEEGKTAKAALCYVEQYHSEIGNKIVKDFKVDVAILINMQKGKISFRSSGDKIHVGNELAKPLGGGGHMNSAGAQISDELKEQISKMILLEPQV